MECDLPKISIVVPVYNCANTIRQCLNSLCELEYPSYEIILVNDGSTDTTLKICHSYPQIKVVDIQKSGPSRARNLGVGEATGEIIAFTDGDCVVHKQWLRELAQGYSEEEVAGVGGNQESPSDETVFGRCIQATFSLLGFATSYMKTSSRISQTQHNPSCNSSYRKTIFTDIGGFDESLWPGEDVDIDIRLSRHNYRLIRAPGAIVGHYRPQSLRKLGNMMQRYGGSAYELFRRYRFFRPLQYVPFVSAILLTTLLFVSILAPPVGALLFLLPFPVVFLLLLFKEGNLKSAGILLCFSLYIYIFWHVGFVKALLKTR